MSSTPGLDVLHWRIMRNVDHPEAALGPNREIREAARCVQCGKCSSGCPVAFESVHTPRQVMRFLQWGWAQEAATSPFVWLCAECQACTVRCPRGIDVAETMLALRRLARRKSWVRPDHFHEALEAMISRKGRVEELRLGVMAALSKWPRHPLEDLLLFVKMLRRGRLK